MTSGEAIEAELCAAYAIWFAGLERGDVAAALSVVTSDVVHQSPSGEVHVGPESFGLALNAFCSGYSERV